MGQDWFDSGGAGAAVDVSALLGEGCIGLVGRLLEHGCLVAFGVSRDGGALGCTITSDGRWRREWFREESELSTFLLGAATSLDSSPRDAQSPPASRGQRARNGVSRGRGGAGGG